MKIFIASSKNFYHKIPEIKRELEMLGHEITLPNSYENPLKEEEVKTRSLEEHIKWKQGMMRLHEPKIKANEGILVLNFEKNGQPNYIGGGTFMEIVKAWELEKSIYLYNPIPNCIFSDELRGINPIILNKKLSLIKNDMG